MYMYTHKYTCIHMYVHRYRAAGSGALHGALPRSSTRNGARKKYHRIDRQIYYSMT